MGKLKDADEIYQEGIIIGYESALYAVSELLSKHKGKTLSTDKIQDMITILQNSDEEDLVIMMTSQACSSCIH